MQSHEKASTGDHKDRYEEAMISLLLVADEPLIRHGLRMWLEQVPDLRVVGEASNGTEAIQLAHVLHPEVILMDLSMHPLDGMSVAAALRQVLPPSTVVLLSLHDDAATRTQATAAGVAVVVGKHDGVKALLAAIRQASRQGSQSHGAHVSHAENGG
jgi:two-component system response regulator NreC